MPITTTRGHRLKTVAASVTAVGALALGACAADDAADAGPSNEGGTSDDAWALEYTRGTEGAATGEPIKIGWVNGEGGVPSFPDATVAADAAIKFANEKLGGLDGRPVELVKCFVDSAEAGRRCATEMINADVPMITTGVMAVGNAEFFGTLDGRIPTMVGVAITEPDLTAKDAFSFGPASPVTLTGLAKFAAEKFPNGGTAVATAIDSPSGRFGLDTYIVPGLKAAGLDVTAVPVAREATGPQIATALSSAGLADADVVISSASPATCAPVYDAIQQVDNPDIVVIDAGSCVDTAFTQYLADQGVEGDFPDGWFFSGPSYSALIPTDAGGVNTYLQAMKDYAPSDTNFYSPFTQYGFAAALSIPAVLAGNADDLTKETALAALQGFDSDYMMISGTPECGRESTIPAQCTFTSGISQYKDGTFTAVHMGNNDDPVIVTALSGS